MCTIAGHVAHANANPKCPIDDMMRVHMHLYAPMNATTKIYICHVDQTGGIVNHFV